MTKLFGVPVGVLAVVLVALLAVAVGALATLALRNRILLRLGTRNVRRRRGRTTLIVLGLMLGTAIIASALATGDTMSHTIRAAAVRSLGDTDEVIAAKGAKPTLAVQDAGSATGVAYFPADDYHRVAAGVSFSPLVDGVAPAIIEPVAAFDAHSRQNEPETTLFATDPADMRGFGTIRDRSGRAVSLGAASRPGAHQYHGRRATGRPPRRHRGRLGRTVADDGARAGDRHLRGHRHQQIRGPAAAGCGPAVARQAGADQQDPGLKPRR
ncbi:MAG TPA: hypothetical protein VFW09_04625 [Solirubrobacteraceae bacterium]|nr:hypothetical protein [Solirubrobacteraceae bacterium]